METKDTRTILLVEDEAIIGLSTKSRLESIGYNVKLATSSKNAIIMAQEDSTIELILMDIDLGNGPNGIDTCKAIIEKKYIPVVFVSSHTEKDIVSLTEQITSYGYIVKSSHLTVYDASIKMAFKLYNEKNKREIFNRYLEAALNNTSEPFFITDSMGDIVFLNPAYLRIQGLTENDGHLVERKFENVVKQIRVFDENGQELEPDEWASSRGVAGKTGIDVPFIVYHRILRVLLVNMYTYSPIKNDDDDIIGAYVKIKDAMTDEYETVLQNIIRNYQLTVASNTV